MPKSAGYVSAEGLRRSAERAEELKRYTYRCMDAGPGARLLDLGCGPGIDTIALARLVGEEGSVVGVDVDEEMVAQADEYARREGLHQRVEHCVADVSALPFANDSFDACRAERLFQVLPSHYAPAQVLAEICRVVKPGGRVVLADADWATASVDFSDAELERRLLSFFARSMRPNGFAGRQLFRLLLDAGLGEIEVEPFSMVIRDYDSTPFQNWLANTAVQGGVASQDEASAWLKELKDRHAEGSFFASVTMLVAAAVRPRV